MNSDPSQQDNDDVEGMDETPVGEPFRDYPIDSLHIRHETRTVFEVLRRIENGQYIMDPEFQREFVWDLGRQSRLIESVLMRIPLPVFYLAENPEGKLIVVDGLQRLTTLKRYRDNEFALELSNNEINGRRFEELVAKLQNRIEDAQLILYIIDHKVPEQAKLDIFDRVNSGVALTRQQMRNCLYLGRATHWVRDEAQTKQFCEATGNSLDSKLMRDREVVNRFCSFTLLGPGEYKGNMDEFLAEGLKKMNGMSPKELTKLRTSFHRGLKNNIEVFGKHAFRKHERDQENRKPFNIALFDVFSVLLANHTTKMIKAHAEELREGFYELMQDRQFVTAISNATNSSPNVQKRFSKASSMIDGVLDVESD